jgi:predicted nucleic acid-binding protein
MRDTAGMMIHYQTIAQNFAFSPKKPTDCIVMTVADDYGTKDIFGFDKQFEDSGYTRLEPSTEWKQAV